LAPNHIPHPSAHPLYASPWPGEARGRSLANEFHQEHGANRLGQDGETGGGSFAGAYHPQLGYVRYESEEMPEDADAQVERTIARMCQYALEDSQTFLIRQDSQVALRYGGGNPLEGVFHLVKGRMKFQQDVDTAAHLPNIDPDEVVEVLIRPVDVALAHREMGGVIEDCDGYSMYCASLLLALGIPCCYATVAADNEDTSRYSHVYVVAYPTINGQVYRVPMDTSHGQYPGWEVPNEFDKLREWPVDYGCAEAEGGGLFGWLTTAVMVIVGAFAFFCKRGGEA